MPSGPHDNQYSIIPPPGFTQESLPLKRVQIIELLQKVLDKYQREPEFVEQEPKQTDLLFSIAQFTLLSASISNDDKRNFLNNIVTIGQDLLLDENQLNHISSIDSNSPLIDNKDGAITTPPSDTPNNEDDGDLSLDDLANEYLQNEPSPSSLNDKLTTPSESGEADLTLDDLSKIYSSSAPSTSVLSNLVLLPISTEPILKSPLESILFSNRLSSYDAADDADCIWKEESSPFGQMFCQKTIEPSTQVTKQISTCLFDRSLYRRLTRLIALLPKQCIRNSVQQLPIRYNGQQQQQNQQYRPHRPHNDNRRPSYRPTFHQNASQAYPTQRYAPPPPPNNRTYTNPNYSNQQVNPGGHFVDRRQQPQQQQYRYPPPPPPPSLASNIGDHQHQQRGPPKNNAHGGGGGGGGGGNQQQKKKPPASSSQNNQHRGPKKGSGGGGGGGGNKLTNEKSGVPGSDPSLNPK